MGHAGILSLRLVPLIGITARQDRLHDKSHIWPTEIIIPTKITGARFIIGKENELLSIRFGRSRPNLLVPNGCFIHLFILRPIFATLFLIQFTSNRLQTLTQWSLGIHVPGYIFFPLSQQWIRFWSAFHIYGLPLEIFDSLFLTQLTSNPRLTLAQWSLGIQVPGYIFFIDPARRSRIIQDFVNPLFVLMLVEWFTCRLVAHWSIQWESRSPQWVFYWPWASHNRSLYWPSSSYDHHLHLIITFLMLTIKITVVVTEGNEIMQF